MSKDKKENEPKSILKKSGSKTRSKEKKSVLFEGEDNATKESKEVFLGLSESVKNAKKKLSDHDEEIKVPKAILKNKIENIDKSFVKRLFKVSKKERALLDEVEQLRSVKKEEWKKAEAVYREASAEGKKPEVKKSEKVKPVLKKQSAPKETEPKLKQQVRDILREKLINLKLLEQGDEQSQAALNSFFDYLDNPADESLYGNKRHGLASKLLEGSFGQRQSMAEKVAKFYVAYTGNEDSISLTRPGATWEQKDQVLSAEIKELIEQEKSDLQSSFPGYCSKEIMNQYEDVIANIQDAEGIDAKGTFKKLSAIHAKIANICLDSLEENKREDKKIVSDEKLLNRAYDQLEERLKVKVDLGGKSKEERIDRRQNINSLIRQEVNRQYLKDLSSNEPVKEVGSEELHKVSKNAKLSSMYKLDSLMQVGTSILYKITGSFTKPDFFRSSSKPFPTQLIS